MKILFPLSFLLLMLVTACTDPITVGSEVLDTDRTAVGEIIDLPIRARVVREDSFLTYVGGGGSFVPQGFTFGQISDPNFGNTRHSVYLTPKLPTGEGNLTVIPPFSSRANILLDSIVLLIPIDTTLGFYGPGRDFPISVTEINSRISLSENRYSDFTAATRPEEISASREIMPTLTPIEVRDTSIFGREFKRAHLRVRLSDAFVRRFDDLPAAAFDTDTVFRQNFAGLYLAPDGDSEALLNLAPNGIVRSTPTGLVRDTPYAGFNCYYTDSTGTKREYSISFQQALPNYSTDYTGSLAGGLIEDTDDSTLIAVAGRGGLITKLNFTDLSELEDKVINRAALELSVADVTGVNYDKYALPPRVELFYRVPPTNFLGLIEDRNALSGRANSVSNVNFFLGGTLIDGDGQRIYDPAFTLHLQRMVDGKVPPTLYLRVFPADPGTPLFPGRVFLNGPAAADNPARVRVTFTELSQ